jgi:hypothetical protein
MEIQTAIDKVAEWCDIPSELAEGRVKAFLAHVQLFDEDHAMSDLRSNVIFAARIGQAADAASYYFALASAYHLYLREQL